MEITWGAHETIAFNESTEERRVFRRGKFMAICVLFMGYDYEKVKEKSKRTKRQTAEHSFAKCMAPMELR